MKISSSPKYTKDLNRFEKSVEKISDPKRKNYFKKLIDEFKFQIKLIDDVHDSSNAGSIKPRVVQEHLKDLITIRHQLETLVKDTK